MFCSYSVRRRLFQQIAYDSNWITGFKGIDEFGAIVAAVVLCFVCTLQKDKKLARRRRYYACIIRRIFYLDSGKRLYLVKIKLVQDFCHFKQCRKYQ